MDTDRRELHRGSALVAIAPQVFDLLDYLIRNRERVVSKDDLIETIWNGRSVSDAALTTRLNAARSAIGDSGDGQRLIKTLPRRGFRFVGAVRIDTAAENSLSRSRCLRRFPTSLRLRCCRFKISAAMPRRNILPTA